MGPSEIRSILLDKLILEIENKLRIGQEIEKTFSLSGVLSFHLLLVRVLLLWVSLIEFTRVHLNPVATHRYYHSLLPLPVTPS